MPVIEASLNSLPATGAPLRSPGHQFRVGLRAAVWGIPKRL